MWSKVSDSELSSRELTIERIECEGRAQLCKERMATFKMWLPFYLIGLVGSATLSGLGAWLLIDELRRSYNSGSWFLDHGLSTTFGCAGLLLGILSVWTILGARKGLKGQGFCLAYYQRRIDEIDAELVKRTGL